MDAKILLTPEFWISAGKFLALIDMALGALPDKYARHHSFIMRAVKAVHEFGMEETQR